MNLNWSILARARRIATSQVMRLTGQPELGQVLPDFLVIGAMKAGRLFRIGRMVGGASPSPRSAAS